MNSVSALVLDVKKGKNGEASLCSASADSQMKGMNEKGFSSSTVHQAAVSSSAIPFANSEISQDENYMLRQKFTPFKSDDSICFPSVVHYGEDKLGEGSPQSGMI